MSSTSTTWTTDTNTKSGTVQVYESNVSVLRILGIKDGNAVLDLFADQGDDNADKWRMWVNASDDDLHFANYTSGAWADLLTIQDGGNVGIGTASPNAMLHINGSDNPQILITESYSSTEFIRLGMEGTNTHMCLGWDDGDIMLFGVYSSPSDNSITEHMRIESDGKVGIGTNDPSAELEIQDTSDQLRLSYDDTNYATFNIAADGLLTITTVDPGGAEADIILAPDGNVGIGTASPAASLDVGVGNSSWAYSAANAMFHEGIVLTRAGDAQTYNAPVCLFRRSYSGDEGDYTDLDDDVAADHTLGNLIFQGYRDDGWEEAARIAVDVNSAGSGYLAGRMEFHVTDTGGTLRQAMTILSAGADDQRVGIGTASPESLLEVRGGTGTGFTGAGLLTLSTAELNVVTNDILGGVVFQAPIENSGTDAILPSAAIWARAVETFDGGNNGVNLEFATETSGNAWGDASKAKMVITHTGDVGIGITNPAASLNVVDDNASGGAAIFHNDGNNANRYGIIISCGKDAYSASTANEAIYIKCQDGNGGAMGGINNSTNIDLPQFYEGSDSRIKENIADTQVDALALLNQFKMREFNKIGYDKTKLGLVAQEVKDVMPELVGIISAMDSHWVDDLDDSMVDSDGNKMMYTIGTGILPYYFIKAIQELSAKVEALENA